MTALMTVEQVAARYQLAPKTIRSYARAGRIVGAQKVGTQWRFDPSTLAVLPVPAAAPALQVVHPTVPTSARRARPGSGRDALRQALDRPIKAPTQGRAA